jgi:uncharacterized membrane protein YeaQ/YmgE (transglycosylase-associated protein family)
METWMPIIIQVISGALGGLTAGMVMKKQSLGPVGNSIAGLLGGGLGGQILGLLGVNLATGGDPNIQNIAGNIATGGVGGGALLAIIGLIRYMIKK